MARRLSAILAADIVGYSRLMGTEEERTMERLRSLYKELVHPAISSRRGRTVKLMGDGLLAEFGSVVDAVACAVAIQNGLPEREKDVSEDRAFHMRIGINLGDVIVQGNDIYGDGVNIAARLESLADPGGICISQAVFEQTQGRVAVEFEDVGDKQVKNISRPIRVYTWHNGCSAALKSAPQRTDQTPSIAVLPFSSQSTDASHEFIADGISEEISTALSKCADLLVVATHSTKAYKDQPLDIDKIAHEQGASHILSGSLRAAGNRVRIGAQLIETKTGVQVWADQYDRNLEDVFDLQDEISLRIATAMLGEMGEGEMARLRGRGTRNLQAWSQHMRAVALMRQVSKENIAEARRWVEKSLELDPDYSAATSTLALTHAMDARHGFSESREESVALARGFAEKALALDADNSEAHGVLGFVANLEGDMENAIAQFRTSLRINPNHAEVSIRLALSLIFNGEAEEAIACCERANRLSPKHPPWFSGVHGFALRAAGRFQDSIEHFEEYGRQVPGFGLVDLVIVYVALGDLEHARSKANELLQHRPDFCISNWAKTQLYSRSKDGHADLEALRAAGLPE